MHPNFLHVLCLTEYHLKYSQLNNVHIKNYNLGAYCCRQLCEKGGVAIFVHNSLCFSNINIVKHCEEQDTEICALKLSFGVLNICVLTLYRAPSGNFSHFLLKLDNILKLLYTPTHTYLLTYLLTPWSRVLLEKRTGLQLVKKLPAFYGTRRFVTAYTSAHHLSLS